MANNNKPSSSISTSVSLFADDDETVMYQTEDGFDIPQEWQTSVLMALDLQHQQQLEKQQQQEQRQNEDGASASNEPQQSQQRPVPAADDQNFNSPQNGDVIADLLLNLERLTQEATAEILAAQKKQNDEEREMAVVKKQKKEKANKTEEENVNDENDDYEEEYEDEDEDDILEAVDEDGMVEGMIESRSAMGMERDETDQSQWKLEEIILRKSVAVEIDDNDDDHVEFEDDDRDAVGASVTRRKPRNANKVKEFSYLCKWAPGGRCRTWELKTTLVDEGFGPQVEEYDRKIKEKGVTERQQRTHFKAPSPYKSIAGKTNPAELAKSKASKRLVVPPPETFVRPSIIHVPLKQHQVFFENLYPNFIEHVRQSAGLANHLVRKIINIAPETPALKLMQLLRDNRSFKTKLLFHGSPAVKSIMQSGLLVPGEASGVTVANGQAFSGSQMRIYAALDFMTSHSYTRGCQQMFLCCGVENSDTYATANIRIFSDSAFIAPIWLIEFEPKPPRDPRIQNYDARLASIPTERFYDWKQFLAPFPEKNEGNSIINKIAKEAQQLALADASGVQANLVAAASLSAKERKKVTRMTQRVLNIRAGVPIEKA